MNKSGSGYLMVAQLRLRKPYTAYDAHLDSGTGSFQSSSNPLTLTQLNFNPIEADPCVFINNTDLIILAFVDDIVLITQTTAEMAKLKAQLFNKFKCHNLGLILHYPGIYICRNHTKHTMELSMESYIDKLGTDFERVNVPHHYHPLTVKALKLQLQPKDDVALPQITQQYQSIIGKLLYSASQLQADIAFAVGYLAHAMSNPTELHFEHALQVLDYLYTTTDLVMKFAGSTICHCSSKQKLVTTTTEAEYISLTHAAKETAWLARLLQQIGYLGKDAHLIKLYSNNQLSIYLVYAGCYHKHTKHIDIYYQYIKGQVCNGYLQLEHIGTKDMAADGLTKPLDKVAHNQSLYQIGLCKLLLLPEPQEPPTEDK
jgi:hypothetical protein